MLLQRDTADLQSQFFPLKKVIAIAMENVYPKDVVAEKVFVHVNHVACVKKMCTRTVNYKMNYVFS